MQNTHSNRLRNTILKKQAIWHVNGKDRRPGGASSDDYDRLHEAMESRNYFREIQDGAGNWFNLPSAEYVAEKNASARAVRDEVVAIAGTIKDNPRVLVSQAADRSWHLIKKLALVAVTGYPIPATSIINSDARGAIKAFHCNKRGGHIATEIFVLFLSPLPLSHNKLAQSFCVTH